MPFGTLLSLIITGFVVSGLDETDPVDDLNRIQTVTGIQNTLITILGLLAFLLFREKPTYPPSKMALIKREITKDGLGDDIKTLS